MIAASLLIVTRAIDPLATATRRGRHATAGETLFGASYLTNRAEEPARIRLRRMLKAALERNASAQPADLVRMAAVFRMLVDVRHLQVARLLLREERSLSELTSEVGMSALKVADAVRDLQEAGLVVGHDAGHDRRYSIANDHIKVDSPSSRPMPPPLTRQRGSEPRAPSSKRASI